MSGGNEFNEAALWRRWHEGQAEAGRAKVEPDALILAAYAENRLARPGADPELDPAIGGVEDWLVDCPDGIDDLLAAQAIANGTADATLIARAQALVAPGHGNIVPLRRRRHDWRNTAAWSGVAASLLAAILIGFSLGTAGVVDLSTGSQSAAAEPGLLGAPGSIIVTDDEDIGI